MRDAGYTKGSKQTQKLRSCLIKKMTQKNLNKVWSKRVSLSRVKVDFVFSLDIGTIAYLMTLGPS